MKPGFKTTEFWLTVIAQFTSLLVMTGMIPQSDTGLLNDAAGKIAAGVVAALTLCKYIHSRTLVKTSVWLLVLLVPTLAQAQIVPVRSQAPGCACGNCQCGIWKPATRKEPTAFWRHDAAVEAELRRHTDLLNQLLSSHNQLVQQNAQLLSALQHQQQVPQQQTPLIVFAAPEQGGPRQQIPLGGPQQQQIPLGGPPQQQIPLGGPPQQNIPLGPAPQQNIPLGTPPLQNIPLGTPAPQQNIPLGTPPPQMPKVPAGPTGYQSYTIARMYYWRPASGKVWYVR